MLCCRNDDATAHVDPAPTLRSQSHSRDTAHPAGEGIGLSIVKRLCELLDASLELETSPCTGTTLRVVFPRAYALPTVFRCGARALGKEPPKGFRESGRTAFGTRLDDIYVPRT